MADHAPHDTAEPTDRAADSTAEAGAAAEAAAAAAAAAAEAAAAAAEAAETEAARLDAEADAELDALAQSIEPGSAPRWEPPLPVLRKDREYDRRLAVLDADGVGEFLRACRASAGLSQRLLAEASGVPQATIARIEAGRAPGVTVATLARLAAECDILLVGTQGSYAPALETDLAQRHRDRAGRLLPAHLFNEPWVSTVLGDARRGRRGVPRQTYRLDVRVRDVPDT